MIVPTNSVRQLACVTAVLMTTLVSLILPCAHAGDPVPNRFDKANRSWPMFGGSPGRNMVNPVERNLPADWCVAEGKLKNVKWMADLGNRTIGSPVVAHGKVFVATNNAKPRDPMVKGPKSVLMAFREADGQFLWQIAHDHPADAPNYRGAVSTPSVVGGKLYYSTPASEVVCADVHGKIQWRYDMIKELQVRPGREWCPERVTPLSSPLVIGDLVFAVTGNGRDEEGNLLSPKAPSFIALDKRNGKLAWQSNLPGENIIEGQWSSPTYADVGGRRQVIFAGGDGVIYSFVPETGALLWKCDCLPQRQPRSAKEIDNYFVGTPVVVRGNLYVGLGLSPDHPRRTRWSYFLCLEISKQGDVSLKSYDANAAANKGSALVWAFGGPLESPAEKGRRVYFGCTLSTAAVHDGLVYLAEELGYLHCLDAVTGKRFWEHDFRSSVLGSPYWVDGRVFVGTEDGEVMIFAHGRTEKLFATIDMDETIGTTPVAANGTLYVATRSKLFAIGSR